MMAFIFRFLPKRLHSTGADDTLTPLAFLIFWTLMMSSSSDGGGKSGVSSNMKEGSDI
jgi:hypothetical protein